MVSSGRVLWQVNGEQGEEFYFKEAANDIQEA